jgi:hypothetical protein
MFRQTEDRYKYIKLGFGDGTIYSYGCYLVSLVNGLNNKGYSFTPEGFNDLLKQNNAWTGQFNNYIDVARLSNIFPNIFVSFTSVDPWNDVPSLDDLLKPDLVVLCRVSAKPIGGAIDSDHFVLLTGKEGGTAVIHDPWTGKEEKISARWGNYGFVKGIRILGVNPYQPPADPGEPEKRVLEVIKSAFAGLPLEDALKGGNLEGYARALVEEHKTYKEYQDKAKQFDGFIVKWVQEYYLPASSGLVEIENEMSKLLPLEDAVNKFRSAVEEVVGVFATDEALLQALGAVKTDKEKLADELAQCQSRLSLQKVGLMFKLGKFIVNIYKKDGWGG